MPPFRMYLVLSILFFLLISVFHDSDSFIDDDVVRIDSEERLDEARDTLNEVIPETADNRNPPGHRSQFRKGCRNRILMT